jgi:hypothetical protein
MHNRFEDRLLEALEQALTESTAAPPVHVRRRPPVRRLALAAVPAGLAASALVLAPALDGSRTATADAAVLSRAAAALEQPGTILSLRTQDYSATGMGPCMLGLHSPLRCVTGPPSGATSTGISADPAQDDLTYSSQEWLSADGTQHRTIYSDGVEQTTDSGAERYSVFDPSANTTTTLTNMPDGTAPTAPAPPDGSTAALPGAVLSNLSDPSFYEQLYREAQTGSHVEDGETTVTSSLVGPTTIAGEPVVELQFTVHTAPPSNPPAGDDCGTSACAPPDREVLLYLDAQTYTPVRAILEIVNSGDSPGVPAGTSVWMVADYSVERLADSPANETLLQPSPHTGATQVTETYAQYRAAQGWPPLAG